MVDCGLGERSLMSFKWKRHGQLYLIKDHFIQWIQINQLEIQGTTDGGSDQETTVLRERSS